jgi:putative flippase GtrA
MLRLPRFLRFILAGVLNTVFGFLIFSLTIYITNGNVALSIGANIVIGVFFNFLTYGYGVFRDLAVQRFFKFVCAYAVLYGVNYFSLVIMEGYILNIYLAQFIILFYLAPLSYFVLNRFVFNPPYLKS